MKKNKIMISALVSLMATGVMAQMPERVLNEIKLDTDAETSYGKSYYAADIDSIVFYKSMLTKLPMMTVFGNGKYIRTPKFAVSDIRGIEFFTRDSRKLYAPKLLSGYTDQEMGHGNAFDVSWEPVWDAKGYEIKYIKYDSRLLGSVDFWGNGEFELLINGQHPAINIPIELPADAGVLTVPAGTNDVVIRGLQYDTQYLFAVRALSADGEEFNSDWSIRSDLARYQNFSLVTNQRYPVPEILTCVSRDETSVRVGFDLSYEAHKAEEPYGYSFPDYFGIVAGRFVADELRVTSTGEYAGAVDEKWISYKLTAEDLANGYIDVTGLEKASPYTFTLVNTNISSLPDAKYNSVTAVTKGSREPVLIPHTPDSATGEYAACDITTVINQEYADGPAPAKAFYLEGDKAYFISGNAALRDGLTLETLPADVAAGKRAKVYMGGITGYPTSCNFMIGGTGKADKDIDIEPITFRNIDFDCPLAGNFGNASMITGNYFLNMYSNNVPFVLEALNIEGCTFQRFVRGFLRVQGNKTAKIKRINCDGNLFYNCGYYDNNGRGYAWFAGDGKVGHNIFSDFRFVNNTIYDSPRTSFITDNGKNLEWTADDKWNIVIENNTFVNFSTRSTGRNIVDLRYVPGGSHFSIQRNLFALARCSDADQRNLNFSGADIRQINGDGVITFEVKDNYSTGCLDGHLKDDGIFTGVAFSATSRSFGAFPEGNMGTADDLKVKVGTTPLKTIDLFVNPNPAINQNPTAPTPDDHKAPDNIMEALRYNQTPVVLNHEIYTKNVGDPRWRN